MKLLITIHKYEEECSYADLAHPNGLFWKRICANSEWNGTDPSFYKQECMPLINSFFDDRNKNEMVWGGNFQPLIKVKVLEWESTDSLTPDDIPALEAFSELNDMVDSFAMNYGEDTLDRLLHFAKSQR
jgi:hypothetical protein